MTPAWPFAMCFSLCVSVVIVMELRAGNSQDTRKTAPFGAVIGADIPARVEVEPPSALSLTELYSRPLFRPDRRAPSDAVTTTPPGVNGKEARLTGVIIGPFGRRAIFLLGAPDISVVVQEGDHVGAYTIRSLHPSRAVVDVAGRIITLVPSFEDNDVKESSSRAVP